MVDWDRFQRSINEYTSSLSNAINRYRGKDIQKLRTIQKSYNEVREQLVELWNAIDANKKKIKDAGSYQNNINGHISTIDKFASDLNENIKAMTTTIEEGIKCPNCGFENKKEDKYCGKCGTELKPKTPTSLAARESEQLLPQTIEEKSPEELKKIEGQLTEEEEKLKKEGKTEEAKKISQKREQVKRIREAKEKERKKLTIDSFKGSERKSIEDLYSAFISSINSILSPLRNIIDIASVADQTPEEQKMLKLARKFQGYCRVDLRAMMQHEDTFLATIGDASVRGGWRMGIIRDELVPVLNDIEKTYGDINNAIKREQRKFKEEKEEAHIKIKKEEEKELKKITESEEKEETALNRLKKIKNTESEFLTYKKQYEQIHHQIVELHNKLTGKTPKK